MADIISSSESIGLAVVSGVGGAEGALFLVDLFVRSVDSDAPDAFLFLCEGGMVSVEVVLELVLYRRVRSTE